MKKIRLFGLILVFMICINCTDEEHPPFTIIGKWKLIEVGGMVVTDYASNNIIYDFQPDGSLIVQSDVGERNGVYETGNYKYKLEPGDPVSNFEAYTFFTNVKIAETNWGCYLAPGKMALTNNPALDGPIVYFRKK